MRKSKRLLGQEGEEKARQIVLSQGMRIVVQNWRNQIGEIDIIARDKNCTVFVEVKVRSSDEYGTAEEAIDTRKQRQIIKVALCYIKENRLEGCDVRFDSIVFQNDDVHYYKDAFVSDRFYTI